MIGFLFGKVYGVESNGWLRLHACSWADDVNVDFSHHHRHCLLLLQMEGLVDAGHSFR